MTKFIHSQEWSEKSVSNINKILTKNKDNLRKSNKNYFLEKPIIRRRQDKNKIK